MAVAATAGAAGAAATEVRIFYVGPEASPERLGVEQGLEEASLQGRFTGQSFALESFVADAIDAAVERALAAPTAAVVAALDAEALAELARRLEPARVAVLNVATGDDDLRRRCRENLLHVAPSAGMRVAAVGQWREQHPGAEVEARAWHPEFLKYAARDLNKRFRAARGAAMDDGAWAGWAAVRIVAEAAARTAGAEPGRILDYLRGGLRFDGQKGVAHTFHPTGQLRQPLLLVTGGEIAGEAPVRGVADVEDLDSLIDAACAQAPAEAPENRGSPP